MEIAYLHHIAKSLAKTNGKTRMRLSPVLHVTMSIAILKIYLNNLDQHFILSRHIETYMYLNFLSRLYSMQVTIEYQKKPDQTEKQTSKIKTTNSLRAVGGANRQSLVEFVYHFGENLTFLI